MAKAKTVAKSKLARSKIIFYACIVAIPILQFAIFYIGVNVNSFLLAFQTWDGELGKYVFNGAGNFWASFKDVLDRLIHGKDQLNYALKNTVTLFIVGTLFGTTLAIVFSYYIYKKHAGSRFFKLVLFLPNVVSCVTLAIMLLYFTTDASKALIGIELITDTKTKLPTLMFISIMLSFGVQVLIYSGAMSGISDSISEAAVLDGITPLKELILIDVPMIFPTISVFIVSSIAGAFMNQMNLFNMYGDAVPDSKIITIGYYLYRNMLGAVNADYPYYAAFGLVLTFITVPLAFITKFLLDKFGPSVD